MADWIASPGPAFFWIPFPFLLFFLSLLKIDQLLYTHVPPMIPYMVLLNRCIIPPPRLALQHLVRPNKPLYQCLPVCGSCPRSSAPRPSASKFSPILRRLSHLTPSSVRNTESRSTTHKPPKARFCTITCRITFSLLLVPRPSMLRLRGQPRDRARPSVGVVSWRRVAYRTTNVTCIAQGKARQGEARLSLLPLPSRRPLAACSGLLPAALWGVAWRRRGGGLGVRRGAVRCGILMWAAILRVSWVVVLEGVRVVGLARRVLHCAFCVCLFVCLAVSLGEETADALRA